MKNLKMKMARMEQNLSQTELARRTGVTRQTIGMIEAGDYNPSLKLCTAICREPKKMLNNLFWEEDGTRNRGLDERQYPEMNGIASTAFSIMILISAVSIAVQLIFWGGSFDQVAGETCVLMGKERLIS